jgi:hypothetical protein
MTTVAHPPQKGYRTIRLPLAESEYDRFLTDRSYAKERLEELYEECAEVFPEAFPWGYAFFGYTEPSMKQQLLCRRIRLDQGRTVFTIAPAFVMPYMLKGERVYIATTAAPDCILGASVAPSASQRALEKAYGVFASEAQALNAD